MSNFLLIPSSRFGKKLCYDRQTREWSCNVSVFYSRVQRNSKKRVHLTPAGTALWRFYYVVRVIPISLRFQRFQRLLPNELLPSSVVYTENRWTVIIFSHYLSTLAFVQRILIINAIFFNEKRFRLVFSCWENNE